MSTTVMLSYESIFPHSQEDIPRNPQKTPRNHSNPKPRVKVSRMIASVVMNTNNIYVVA